MDWWNSEYTLRRKLKVQLLNNETIPAGHPLTFSSTLEELADNNKFRDDYEDIEVVYWNESGATPQWELLAYQIEYDSETDTISITFNAVEDILEENSNYYIYSSNLTLFDKPTRPSFEDSRYITELTPSAGNGIMFSRPTEDWLNGMSLASLARASINFYGKDLQISTRNGPDRGIFELIIDGESKGRFDTYGIEYEDTIMYTASDLEIGDHFVRIRTTGNKSASSSNSIIEIVSFAYSTYIEAQTVEEEISTSTGIINFNLGT